MPARRMFFSIRRACPSSSSTITMFTGSWSGIFFSALPHEGQDQPKGGTRTEFGLDFDITAEAIGKRAGVGKADPLPLLVLDARPSEEVEHAFVIARLDAPTIVGDRDPCAPEIRSAVDPDDTGSPRLQIFEGIL